MANNLPYYPYYVNDFDEDENVLAMNLSEVGLYQLALNEAWKRGSIPADPKALAVLIRRKPAEVCKAWPKVLPCWIPNCVPGRLVNPRQEKERELATNRSAAAADSGRKGAEKRWSSSDRVAYGDPNSSTFESRSVSVSTTQEEQQPAHAFIDFETFMHRWKQHKGLKKPPANIRERAEARWNSAGFQITEEQLGIALDVFCESDWAKREGFPMLGFLRDPMSWSEKKAHIGASSTWTAIPDLVRLKEAFDTIGAPTIPADWDKTTPVWETLTAAEHEKAISRVPEYDGAFMKRPVNYLRDREFDRPPRPLPKSNLEKLMETV